MQSSQRQVCYALQSPVDQAITRLKNFKGTKKGKDFERYIKQELSFIRIVADLQTKLAAYKQEAKYMTEDQLIDEIHESDRLGKHMRAQGLAKPGPNWEAHAIISGTHNEAATLRAILAMLFVRVDDPDNGSWLPKTESDREGTVFPRAVVHGRIHRYHYYRWLEDDVLRFDMSEPEIRVALRVVRHKLQTTTFPAKVMKRKGEK